MLLKDHKNELRDKVYNLRVYVRRDAQRPGQPENQSSRKFVIKTHSLKASIDEEFETCLSACNMQWRRATFTFAL